MTDSNLPVGSVRIRGGHVCRLIEHALEGEVWEVVRPFWIQDTGDYSWYAVDREMVLYRVSRVAFENGDLFWAAGWTESYRGPGLRISGNLHPSLESAKLAIENLAIV